jgi:hypothetical protein
MALHAVAGCGRGGAAWRWHAASTISAPLRAGCQVRWRQPGIGEQCPGAITRSARQTAASMTRDMPATDGPRDGPAAETGVGELIEVTFSPAEPQLTPGAAQAVLAMLLRAREKADRAEGRRT